MPTLGELFDKLGRDAGLSVGDRLALRQKGNNLETQLAYNQPGLARLPFFYTEGAEFEVLPHDMASLRFASQAISTGTTFQDLTVSDPSGATWSKGLSIDVSNGVINVSGVPIGAVISFTMWMQFDANSTGVRALQWRDNSGNSTQGYEFGPSSAHPTYINLGHKRQVVKADTSYKIQVFQDSGGDLNGAGLFVAERIK